MHGLTLQSAGRTPRRERLPQAHMAPAVMPPDLPGAWGSQRRRWDPTCPQTEELAVCNPAAQLCPSSGGHQDQLRCSEAASAHSTQGGHSPGTARLTIHPPRGRVSFFSSLQALVGRERKEKGRRRPKGRGQCPQCIYLAQGEERGCSFEPQASPACLPVGSRSGGGHSLRRQLPALLPFGRQTGWPWPEIICFEAFPAPEAPGQRRFCGCCLNS